MPHLPRVGAFPIAGERSIITAAGAALRIPAKEKNSPLIGNPAPEILAKDHLSRTVSLHNTIALGRPIILYFFPLAGSPHCTKESCSFRDAVGTSPIFNDLNAVVIGISQDPPSRSKRFVDEHHLGFRILHDENRQIMSNWGVGRGLLGLIDGRCTFVIDHDGIVRGMLDGVWDYQGHRDFAEKWLCRIEHELSGRQRFFIEHDGDDTIACDDEGRHVKVIYGSDVASRAIATAPRHGAASSVARKTTKSTKTSRPPTTSKLEGDAAELASPSLQKSKSRKNIKGWLRPSLGPENKYDEPVLVEYKRTNRSVDDIAREQQQYQQHHSPGNGQSKPVMRTRSLRGELLSGSARDESSPPMPANAAAIAKEASDRSPRSNRGSGSGWATPSTISARSISTGETSLASPRADTRDTIISTTSVLAAVAPDENLERSNSGNARKAASSTASGPAALGMGPLRRSSSLHKRVSIDAGRQAGNGSGRSGSPSRSARASHGSRGPEDVPQDVDHTDTGAGSMPIYANGNIAKLQLLPRESADRSLDSLFTTSDVKTAGRSSFSLSTDSPRVATASLPILPRPTSRMGAGVKVQQQQQQYSQLRPNSARTSVASRSQTPTPGPNASQSSAERNGSDGEESANRSSVVQGRRVRVDGQGASAVPVAVGSPVPKAFNGSTPPSMSSRPSSALPSDRKDKPSLLLLRESQEPAVPSSPTVPPTPRADSSAARVGTAVAPPFSVTPDLSHAPELSDAVSSIPASGNAVSLGRSSLSRRRLPEQSPVPAYAPPPAPPLVKGSATAKSIGLLSLVTPSPSPSLASIPGSSSSRPRSGNSSTSNTNGVAAAGGLTGNNGIHVSPSASTGLGISHLPPSTSNGSSAVTSPATERRLSLTPSVTSSLASADNDYSPSIAESHHTFGGFPGGRGSHGRSSTSTFGGNEEDNDEDDHSNLGFDREVAAAH
ncbi:AhpC-TSA-domain-containing protein [Testicularia cyperi]|uniref:thioredoxin-dependent peroxiredoxin n=1 Tax=Testicularia cyperi TaxID=1882483 RepID=A0A317XQJ0_9BASI|nr:AhpC-TSA-domain-containing protein [Testicularia cyperi]